MPILHLTRCLHKLPELVNSQGVVIRQARFPDELPRWLALRESATADLKPRPGEWTIADARRELWAVADRNIVRTWVAEIADLTESRHASDGILAGTVSLAIRRQGCSVAARIHWLLVHPRVRRRGIGRLLMATAESACFEAGIRQVSLETHRNWKAAVEFYRRLGYA